MSSEMVIDTISHAKTGKLHANFFIPDVNKKIIFFNWKCYISLFCTANYIHILHAVLYKIFFNPKKMFSRKQHFCSVKIIGIIELYVVYSVCNVMRKKDFHLRSIIRHF